MGFNFAGNIHEDILYLNKLPYSKHRIWKNRFQMEAKPLVSILKQNSCSDCIFPFQRGTHANGSFKASFEAAHTSETPVMPLCGKHLNGPVYNSNENEQFILCPVDMVELSSMQPNHLTPQLRWYLQTSFWYVPPLVYGTPWSLFKHCLEDSFLAQMKITHETVLINIMDNHVLRP